MGPRLRGLSYDIAVWEGEAPPSDEAAQATFVKHAESAEASFESEGIGPTPAIRRYVDALLERWPDIDSDAGDDSPWAFGPLISEAVGPSVFLHVVFDRAEEASEFAARLAAEHGLVCFDPQVSRVLT